MAARAEMTTELSSLAMCIKDRTVRHKQASTYICGRKLFKDKLNELDAD